MRVRVPPRALLGGRSAPREPTRLQGGSRGLQGPQPTGGLVLLDGPSHISGSPITALSGTCGVPRFSALPLRSGQANVAWMTSGTPSGTPGPPSGPRLLHQLRLALRLHHYSRRTEEAYVGWVNSCRLWRSVPG